MFDWWSPDLSLTDSGLSMAMSTDVLNQMMFAMWQGGLLDQSLNAADLGVDPALLGLLLPGIDDATIVTTPGLPPVFTPREDWADGNQYDFSIGGMAVDIYDGDSADGTRVMSLYVAMRLPVALGATGEEITMTLGEATVYTDMTYADPAMGLSAAAIEPLFGPVLAGFVPELTGELSSIPLPSLDGFTLSIDTTTMLGGDEPPGFWVAQARSAETPTPCGMLTKERHRPSCLSENVTLFERTNPFCGSVMLGRRMVIAATRSWSNAKLVIRELTCATVSMCCARPPFEPIRELVVAEKCRRECGSKLRQGLDLDGARVGLRRCGGRPSDRHGCGGDAWARVRRSDDGSWPSDRSGCGGDAWAARRSDDGSWPSDRSGAADARALRCSDGGWARVGRGCSSDVGARWGDDHGRRVGGTLRVGQHLRRVAVTLGIDTPLFRLDLGGDRRVKVVGDSKRLVRRDGGVVHRSPTRRSFVLGGLRGAAEDVHTVVVRTAGAWPRICCRRTVNDGW